MYYAPANATDGVVDDDMLRSNGLSLIWRSQRGTVLTAGDNRVTSDDRIDVIHDKGGDVYVLSISNLTVEDSGVYVCEVNTQPPTRTFHKLIGSILQIDHF